MVDAKPQKHTPGKMSAQVTTGRFHLSGSRNVRNGASNSKLEVGGYRSTLLTGGVLEFGASVVQAFRKIFNRLGVKGGSLAGSLKFRS